LVNLPKVKVKFYLGGNNVPLDRLTKQLGITPSISRKKEDWPKPSIEAGIAEDVWGFWQNEVESKAIGIQFDEFQQLLVPKKVEIINLMREYHLSCAVTIVIKSEDNDYPELVLSPENVRFLGDIGAEIGFDLYMD